MATHRHLSTTERYGALVPDYARDAIALLGKPRQRLCREAGCRECRLPEAREASGAELLEFLPTEHVVVENGRLYSRDNCPKVTRAWLTRNGERMRGMLVLKE